MLNVINISKSFGDLEVLKGLSVNVESAELFVILGPSGGGKTTFLNIVAGLLRPESGEIYIAGRLVENSRDIYTPPERRNIGYVFQSYALYPHMTAYDNIAFPLKMARWSKKDIDKAVKEVAEMLNIRDVLHKKPAQLSGGQRQRVAIARAIVKRPTLLLMDEPFSNIDPVLRENVRVEIKRLLKDLGITTLMVTHDREEAYSLADRLSVLIDGRFAQIGRPDEVYSAPCCVEVARFLGYNLVSADGSSLGFRAEDVEIGGGDLSGEVLSSEYKGRYWVVYIKYNGYVIKAYHDAPIKEGAKVKFSIRRVLEMR
ncbi:ABC transporter ATP-binding protein [Pyrobaculum aerophilum]|nr:ABC transporter ATP-binding protein [Pyrobaculum aerophilum]